MLISELVDKSGLSKDTIRFYEKVGLIRLERVSRRGNNYKEYSEQVLEKLLLIRRLKDMGFSLNEIDTFFSLWKEENASCSTLKHALEDKIVFINDQLSKLIELKSRVVCALEKCNSDNCDFEKTVPTLAC